MKHLTRSILLLAVAGAFAAQGAVNVQIQANGKYYTSPVYKGPVEEKYDIVFLGDGFTANEQGKFNERVGQAILALQAMTPYDERKMCWANVWRVNVVSAESGVDHPLQNNYKNSALDCTYGTGTYNNPERLITCKNSAAAYEAAGYAPAWDAIFILVNDEQWGGGRGAFVTSSIHPGDQKHPGGFGTIVTHELGHMIGNLADEYSYRVGPDVDGNLPYPYGEPSSVNLTTQTDPNLIKWKDFIQAGTPIPTTVNQPFGVVGLWEGGGYYAYDIYRPAMNCHMKTAEAPFCAVCRVRMREILSSHCADCDVTPLDPECWFFDLHKHLRFTTRFNCKFPLPKCPLCPESFLDNQILYVLEGATKETVLQVTDQLGEVIAVGVPGKDGLQVAFTAGVDQQYYIQVISPDVPASGVDLTSTLFQNGVEQELAE